MAASTMPPIIESFGVDDAKIQAILTDPRGGTPTYGDLIDVPGIKTVTLAGNAKKEDLRGDRQLIDSRAVLQTITLTFNEAELSFEALAVMLGGAYALTGDAPQGIGTYSLQQADQTFPPFRFEAQALIGPDEGSDTHIVLAKCRLDAMPGIAFADESFHIFAASASVIPLRSTGAWLDIVTNETAVDIAAAA